jgi:hypothetical protein
MFATELAIHLGEIVDLVAFAGIDEKGGAFNFAAAALVKFAEGGDQGDRKIIYAIKPEVFEGIEYRTFAGTGQAGEKHKLAAVALSSGTRHGGGR